MAKVLHPAPRISSNEGVLEELTAALGDMLFHGKEAFGEIVLGVERERIEDVLRLLRDEHGYQQLMEIAGVDYPQREERFEVVYMLLSLTKNHRIMVKVRAAEDTPVPTVTTLWPNAGWLEREVFDLYGVLFDGNTDLRRILTDYGFEGHPFRKDFPLTGYQEVRYSEEEKRVVYQPVELAQDFRSFDFMSPWEGADYILPGDEKSDVPPPAPRPQKVEEPDGTVDTKNPETRGGPDVDVPKTTDGPEDTGAGPKADEEAAERDSAAAPAKEETGKDDPGAPAPTEDRPARAARKGSVEDTEPATETEKKEGDK